MLTASECSLKKIIGTMQDVEIIKRRILDREIHEMGTHYSISLHLI